MVPIKACKQKITPKLLCLILAGLLSFAFLKNTSLLASEAETAATLDNIERTINILENDKQRTDLITLLKLMAVVNQESQSTPIAIAPAPLGQNEGLGFKAWVSSLAANTLRHLKASKPGLSDLWFNLKSAMNALAHPVALDMWQPYVLKVFLGGLVCLLLMRAVISRYAALPSSPLPFKHRLLTLMRYILVLLAPTFVSLFFFFAIPPPANTALGVTANMATGFNFIHAFMQYFFINISVLYVFYQIAQAMLSPNEDKSTFIGLKPHLALHILRTLKVFAAYFAVAVFIREVFLENFALGIIYNFLLTIIYLPLPIYLTHRLRKL
ncbi:MAG: hypothetical protein ACRCTY_03720, partial [Candidatus Adiutrix sp.]